VDKAEGSLSPIQQARQETILGKTSKLKQQETSTQSCGNVDEASIYMARAPCQ